MLEASLDEELFDDASSDETGDLEEQLVETRTISAHNARESTLRVITPKTSLGHFTDG